jgi:hypothetical protein
MDRVETFAARASRRFETDRITKSIVERSVSETP